jgi:hypothetical protein
MAKFEASYSAEIVVSSLQNCLQLISCSMHDEQMGRWHKEWHKKTGNKELD